jgi:hypothetical protein
MTSKQSGSTLFHVLLLLLLLALLGTTGWMTYKRVHLTNSSYSNASKGTPPAAAMPPIKDFESCAVAGNIVEQTSPATCITKDGHRFVQ